MMVPYIAIALSLFSMIAMTQSFRYQSQLKSNKRLSLHMKWSFGMGVQNMQEAGLVGNDGEFYFHPQKPAKIVGPDNICGKKLFIPILPYNNFVLPGSNEQLNIFEMRHRQLLNEVEQNGNIFGLVYMSQAFQRISLVGTICRVKSRSVTDDGRISAVIEGLDRFYLEEVVSEKPFIKGLVRTFKDYTEAPDMLDQLELQIFGEVQTNLKVRLHASFFVIKIIHML